MTFLVEQAEESLTVEVEDPHVYTYNTLYLQNAIIYHSNGLWPSTTTLWEWITQT